AKCGENRRARARERGEAHDLALPSADGSPGCVRRSSPPEWMQDGDRRQTGRKSLRTLASSRLRGRHLGPASEPLEPVVVEQPKFYRALPPVLFLEAVAPLPEPIARPEHAVLRAQRAVRLGPIEPGHREREGGELGAWEHEERVGVGAEKAGN